VTGHEEALEQYRGAEDTRMSEDTTAPHNDPWAEDLFHLLQPARPPVRTTEDTQPLQEELPELLLPGPIQNPLLDDGVVRACYLDSPLDELPVLPSTAFLVAGMLLVRGRLNQLSRTRKVQRGRRPAFVGSGYE
jgi:hypothetical protein